MGRTKTDTADRIVDVAREMFGRNGYANTSVNEIARDAFVTKGAVYHYFGSKEGMFRAVHARVVEEVSARAAAGAGSDGHPLDLIQAGVAEFLDAVLEPSTQRIIAVDGPAVLGVEWEQSAASAEGMSDFRDYLAKASAAGTLPKVDADALAYVIRGACLRAASAIAAADDQLLARRNFGDAVRVLVNGLGDPRLDLRVSPNHA